MRRSHLRLRLMNASIMRRGSSVLRVERFLGCGSLGRIDLHCAYPIRL